MASHVMGRRTVGSTDQYGPEVVVSAVTVDRQHGVHPAKERVQTRRHPGHEAGGRKVVSTAIGLDHCVKRAVDPVRHLSGYHFGGPF